MILHEVCQTCNKPIKSIQSEIPHGGFITYVWNCGHIQMKPKPKNLGTDKNEVKRVSAPVYEVPEPTHEELYDNLDRWVNEGGAFKKSKEQIEAEELELKRNLFYSNPIWNSLDGKKQTYEYQKDGVKFAEEAQLKLLFGDATGVGKTIEALMCVKRNMSIVKPIIIITRSAILYQFGKEYHEWVSKGFTSCIVVTSRHNIFPGFDCYIISKDFLARSGVLELVKKLNPKCIIMDEVQDFKDDDAKRTKALIDLIQSCKIQYRIALSGTAIKNRVSEYFTILNLLDPINFNSRKQFQKDWLVQNEKGQYTKLNKYKEDLFAKVTGKYIIRREKHEVLKDLPPLTRDFQLIEIEDEDIKASYNHNIGLFQSFLNNDIEEITSTQILGWLARLRAITGMAKVQYAVEWISEFLETNDESIAIGIHHENVRELLYNVFKVKGFAPLSLSGKDNALEKNRIANLFNSGSNRILIVNSLAGGVGLNLQSCANAVVLERQWNPADETQFEGRFHRDGQKQGVTMTYFIARGTIDEFFHDMVFEKQKNLSSVGIGEAFEEMNNLTSLKEFADFVASNKI